VKVTLFAPCKELTPYVSSFSIVEAADTAERTLLPDAGIVLGLRYSGSATLIEAGSAQAVPGNTISGLRLTARRMRTSAGGGMVVAKLREAGAYAFFTDPLHHLYAATRPLEDYIPTAEVASVSRAMARADCAEERVAIFERLLLARCTGRAPDPEVSEALGAIDGDPAGVRIAAIAKSVGLSQDALEKRFRRVVGMSPKAFASLVQFRRALDAHSRSRATLTELALDTGFYDQSHFIRRFQTIAGAPPGIVLGSEEYC
jgi:AraC-like DNA-binding protein